MTDDGPTPIGDILGSWGLVRPSDDLTGFAAEFKRRWMAKQAAGNLRTRDRRTGRGAFEPDEDDDQPTPDQVAQQQWESILGARKYSGYRLARHFDPKVVRVAERWLSNPTHPLLIPGQTGRGKTALAAAVAHAYGRGSPVRPVVWVTVQDDLLAAYERRDDLTEQQRAVRKKLDFAAPPTLVVLNDLPSMLGRPAFIVERFVGELTRLVDSDVRLIVTTNLLNEDRVEALEDRIRDRIESGGKRNLLGLSGPSRRGEPDPEPPTTEPCPYHCSNGRVLVDQLDNGVDIVEDKVRGLGTFPKEPNAEAFDDPAVLAERQSYVARSFDRALEGTVAPCPHCRPSDSQHLADLIREQLTHLDRLDAIRQEQGDLDF